MRGPSYVLDVLKVQITTKKKKQSRMLFGGMNVRGLTF